MAKQRCPLNFSVIAGTNILCELQHAIAGKKNHFHCYKSFLLIKILKLQ